MTGDERLDTGVHEQYRSDAQQLGGQLQPRANALLRHVLTELAQTAARDRDDNHVGTEHLILGLYLSPESRARRVLEDHGISHDLFEAVLDDEAGPSPEGLIPYTVRAVMIGGLAVLEADAVGEAEVSDLHLLLGALAESDRWERQHAWGPHHLRAAIELAGATVEQIAAAARAALTSSSSTGPTSPAASS